MTVDYARILDDLLPAVLAAARVQMRYFADGVATETKADSSPVTAADRDSEVILNAALARIAPTIPIVAEELAAAGHTPPPASTFFLVDPLDGTKEFIARSGEFTINVALVENRTPTFGLIYTPAIGTLYMTTAPGRAVEATIAPDAPDAALASLATRVLATREPDETALVALDSRSHKSAATEAFLAKLAIASTRSAGSSLKFCLVARGEADLYARLGPTCEWDTAAGHAILLAAGGCVTTLDGAPLLYGKSEAKYLNPHFVAWGRRPLATV